MKNSQVEIPDVPLEQQTPLVSELLEIIEKQSTLIDKQSEERQKFRDEIAELKKHKGKPKIPPSRLEKDIRKKSYSSKRKRAGSRKRSKTANLKIDEVQKKDLLISQKGQNSKNTKDMLSKTL